MLEALEDRKLLSSGMGSLGGFAGWVWRAMGCGRPRCPRSREAGTAGSSEAVRLACGGGMNNPSLLLTAPLLEGGSGADCAAVAGVFSDSARPASFPDACKRTSRTTFRAGPGRRMPRWARSRTTWTRFARERSPAPPRQPRSRLTRLRILASMGLTQAQITQIQSDQQALQTAITTASASTSTTSTREHDVDGTATTTHPGPRPLRHRRFRRALQTLADRPEKRHAEQLRP